MRPEHLLVYLSLAWLIGIALAKSLGQPTWVWLALAGLWAAALFFIRGRGRAWRGPVLWALAFSLGAARYQSVQPRLEDPAFVAAYNERGPVTLEGLVIAPPDRRDSSIRLRLRAEVLETHDDGAQRPVYGVVLVNGPPFPAYGYGDRLRISGALETPPVFEDFDYRDYLARQGVHAQLRVGSVELLGRGQCAVSSAADCNALLQAVYDLKARSLETIGRLFPEPQAALLSGIVLGVETSMPETLKEAFRATGTSHVIAISGFNVSIVAGALVFLSRLIAGPHARRRSAALAILGIALFTLLVGADASVVRAAVMASLAQTAHLLGRQVFAPGALLGTAFLMTLFNPNVLWDVGFQLSLMATLGLVLYAEPVSAALTGLLARLTSLAADKRVARFTSEFIGLTLAAQITTLPLTIYYFGRVSLISLLANTLIVPVQPAVMVLGSLAALIGQLWLPLGTFLAWLTWPFVTFTIAVVEGLARVPGGSAYFGWQSPGWLAGSYGLIFGATWLANRKPAEPAENAGDTPQPGFRQRHGPNMLLGALVVGVAAIWSAALSLPDGRLHVTALDVGRGEAILAQTPSGEFALIGGGPSSVRLAEGLGRQMPFWQRRLGLVVVPGSDDEQVRALATVLPRFQVSQALLVGQADAARLAPYRELIEGLDRRGVPVIPAEAGQEFDLGDEARLKVLAVGGGGLVLRLEWDYASFLLPIGDSADLLAQLYEDEEYLTSTVMLVPAEEALDLALLEAVSPRAVAISVGIERPAPETLAVLGEAGYAVQRTDLDGWVSFATDGRRLWTEAER